MLFHFLSKLVFSKRAGSLVRRIAMLSTISIFLSVSSFLIVLFVMNGMSGSIANRLMAIEPHLNLEFSEPYDAKLALGQPIVQRLSEDPTNRVHFTESQDLIVRSNEGQFRGAMARGLTPESFRNLLTQLNELAMKNKKALVNDEFKAQDYQLPEKNEILIGVDLARSLGVFEGDVVSLVSPEALLLPEGEVPRIEKVSVKTILATNVPDIDEKFIYYRVDSAVSRLTESIHRGVEVWLKNPQMADTVKNELSSFGGVSIDTWMDRNQSMFFALKMERITIGLFLVLAALIASCGVVTVLSLLISQKKRDIAILKTVGLSGRSAVKLFTGIGFGIAMIGVVGGVLLGTGLGLYIQAHPLNILPDIYYDNEIPAKVDFLLVGGVLFISSIIALAGAWIPASIAGTIQPAEALRVKN